MRPLTEYREPLPSVSEDSAEDEMSSDSSDEIFNLAELGAALPLVRREEFGLSKFERTPSAPPEESPADLSERQDSLFSSIEFSVGASSKDEMSRPVGFGRRRFRAYLPWIAVTFALTIIVAGGMFYLGSTLHVY